MWQRCLEATEQQHQILWCAAQCFEDRPIRLWYFFVKLTGDDYHELKHIFISDLCWNCKPSFFFLPQIHACVYFCNPCAQESSIDDQLCHAGSYDFAARCLVWVWALDIIPHKSWHNTYWILNVCTAFSNLELIILWYSLLTFLFFATAAKLLSNPSRQGLLTCTNKREQQHPHR